ncbi:MAG TPA: hypothetical protein VG184_03795 [Acidimicrobiales bacterium]|nr:hypothetical protein [Acidimicrobiales bacterium]
MNAPPGPEADTRGSGPRWSGARALFLVIAGVLAWGFIQPGALSPAAWAIAGLAAVVLLPQFASGMLAAQDAKAYRQMVEGWKARGAGGPGCDAFDLAVLAEVRHPASRDERASGLIMRWAADDRWEDIAPVLSRATWDFRRCVGGCLEDGCAGADLPPLIGMQLLKVRLAGIVRAPAARAQVVLATAVAVLEARGRQQAAAEISRRWQAT